MYLPRTLIVSDHPFNSECIYALLSTFSSIELVDWIANYNNPIENFSEDEIDVLIVDVYENSSIEKIQQLFKYFPRARKLVIADTTNLWFLSTLLHIGANGLFITTARANELSEAITSVYYNRWYLPEDLYNKLQCEVEHMQSFSINGNRPVVNVTMNIDALTNRELQILRLMAKGEPSSQIANELFISESTVFTHRKHILKKLGFSNTPSLIRCAVEQGVI